MLNIDLILEATGGALMSRGTDGFAGLSVDTRTIGPREVFLALRGERRDGHDFLGDALARGAGAIVSDESKAGPHVSAGRGGTVILVPDTLAALHGIARRVRDSFGGPVIGIVGSNGKTTTKELTACILERRFRVLKTPGNLNNHIGMPLSVSRCAEDTDVMVLEMGTNRPGDVETLCRIALPDCAVITNIGYEHLEGLGSLEKVRDAELEIAPFVKRVIANGDDLFLMDGLRSLFSGEVVTFGVESEKADVAGSGIQFTAGGVRFLLKRWDGAVEVQTRLWGRVNVYNCLAAAAAASALGLSLAEIREGIETFVGVEMRYEVLEYGGATIINDVYNANPSSVRESLRELARRAGEPGAGRAIAVLGGMFELGRHEREQHESLGRWMSELSLDIFVAVGPLMENAAACFRGRSACVGSAEEAGRYLAETLKTGDVILVKGSRGMKMEGVVATLRDFSSAGPRGRGTAYAV